GFAYHLRGIGRLPGGWRLGQYNVVMGPPIFAPLLTCSVGVLGLLAALLRRELPSLPPWDSEPAADLRAAVERARDGSPLVRLERRVAHGEFQRALALTSAAFAVLAGGEAYFEHLRGSFNQQ